MALEGKQDQWLGMRASCLCWSRKRGLPEPVLEPGRHQKAEGRAVSPRWSAPWNLSGQ